jgi:enamine deaminase RidA (YjgF/YER057c/UK114 family)
MSETRFVQPDGLFIPATLSSHVAIVGTGRRLVFVKGQLGIDQHRGLAGPGMREQAERAYRNVDTALRAVGGTLADVVKFTVYVSRYTADDGAAIVAARRAVFPPAWAPPSTLIVVASFVLPEALIEVEAVAAVRTA